MLKTIGYIVLCGILASCQEEGKESSNQPVEEVILPIPGIESIPEKDFEALATSVGWDEKASETKGFLLFKGFSLDSDFPFELNSNFEFPLTQILNEKDEKTLSEYEGLEDVTLKFLVVQEQTFQLLGKEEKKLEVVAYVQKEAEKFIFYGGFIADALKRKILVAEPQAEQNSKFYLVLDPKRSLVAVQFNLHVEHEKSEIVPLTSGVAYSTHSPFLARVNSVGQGMFFLPSGMTTNLYIDPGVDFKREGFNHFDSNVVLPLSRIGEFDDLDPIRFEAGESQTSIAYDKKLPLNDTSPIEVYEISANMPSPRSQSPSYAPVFYELAKTGQEDFLALAQPEAKEKYNFLEAKREFFSRAAGEPEKDDLSCTGWLADGTSSLNTKEHPNGDGWHFYGDVMISNHRYFDIFPTNEVDLATGYCMLSTGGGIYANSGDTAQIFNTAGQKTAKMWQKIKVPAAAKTLHVRMAMLTQEYPTGIGNAVQDLVWMKFKEDRNHLFFASLNRLADFKDDQTECRALGLDGGAPIKDSTVETVCGGFESTYQYFALADESNHAFFGGVQFDSNSLSDENHAIATGCGKEGESCYSGFLPPRRLCVKVPEKHLDQVLTLEFGVADGGDNKNTTAWVIDSIAFSDQDCTKKFTDDDDLPAVSYRP